MNEKRYICISEFGDVYHHKGEIPEEMISASDDGIYDLIDITNPDLPLRHWEGKWIEVDALPIS